MVADGSRVARLAVTVNTGSGVAANPCSAKRSNIVCISPLPRYVLVRTQVETWRPAIKSS